MAARDEQESGSDSDAESVCSTLSEASSTGGEPSSKVYFGSNLPSYITEKYVREHFAKHGFGHSVTSVTMFYCSRTHRSKGCGYVTFTSPERAQEAIQKLNGSILLGDHRLVIRPYQRKRKRPEKRKPRRPASPSKKERQPSSTKKRKPVQTPGRPQTTSSNRNDPLSNRKGNALPVNPQTVGVFESQHGLVPPSDHSDSSTPGELCKVRVGSNLPDCINTEHLQEHFKMFKDAIVNIEIVNGKAAEPSQCIGIITFSSAKKAEETIVNLNGSKLGGRFPLKLSFEANTEPQNQIETVLSCHTQQAATNPTKATEACPLLQECHPQFSDTIRVENLHLQISEEEVRAMAGVPIVSCKLESTGPDSQQATLKLSRSSDSRTAIASIDGKNLLDQVVSATPLHPTPVVSESKHQVTCCLPLASTFSTNEIVIVKVTNLPPKISGKTLRKVFERHGRICAVELVTAIPPHALVSFYTLEEAETTSAKLNNTVLRERQIQVQVQYPAGVAAAVNTVKSVEMQSPTHPDVKLTATSLYFSIPYPTDKKLPNPISKRNFFEYLKHRLAVKAGEFKILQLRREQDQTRIEVQFTSNNKAKKALRLLDTDSSDFNVSLAEYSTVPIVSEIENFRESIEKKRRHFLAEHGKKLEQITAQQRALQLPKKCPLDVFERLSAQRAVVQQQIEECQHQEEEFSQYCKTLLENLQHLKSSAPSARKPLEERVSAMRKDFGKECIRFQTALPIYAKRQEILKAVQTNQLTILIGETGSGKSTQIVQYLYDAGFAKNGLIACTQPRKVAAVTLATRVSTEMGVKLGTVLGYKMGISGKHSKQTRVLYLTDHALLNECIADKELSNYSCLVIDEAHERSLHTDLLLCFIKELLPRREDLRVVITSATIDPALFNQYFGGDCPIVRVPGRTFPVDVIWNAHKATEPSVPVNVPDSPITMDYISEVIKVTKRIHREEDAGHILIFLTSPAETERACQIFSGEVDDRAVILPLHGKLQPEDQQKAFREFEGKRKIIFATNVAETSVTIPGVRYIVDTGLAKELCFDPSRNMNSLEVRVISKSSAEQRKGRAGRTSAGKCYRLYSQDIYDSMLDRMLPEILRVHLAHAILKLYEFGITDILAFDFVEHPDPAALITAVETLKFLGAVKEGQLTDLGKKIAVLPLDPQLAKVLLDGIDAGVGLEAAVAVAISSLAGNVFFRGGTDEMKCESDKKKTQFCHPAGDQMTYLSAYQTWVEQKKDQRTKWCVDNYINAKSMRMVEDMVKEFRDTLSRHLSIQLLPKAVSMKNAEANLPKLFFDTFIRNISVFLGHEKAGYMTENMPGEPLFIFPGSALCQLNLVPKCVIYEKTLKTSQHFLLQVIPVKEEWIQEAISSGRLACHPADRFANAMVTPASITNIGQCVFKTVINRKKLPEIKTQLQQVCEGTPYTLESEYDKGMITVFSQSGYHAQALQLIDGHLSNSRENLKKTQYEVGLTKPDDDVKLVMGLGGSVQHVLMPYHYRTVVLKGPPDGEWLEEVRTFLSQQGEIEKEYSKFRKQDCRLFATFRSPQDAVRAVRSLEAPQGITIEPHLQCNSGEAGGKFTLKIEWCRRERENFGFVDFSCWEDLEIAKRYLVNPYGLAVSGSRVTFCPSKDEDKVMLFVRNVSHQVTDEALKAAVELHVPDINVKAHVGFQKSFETTPEQLSAIKKQLEGLIEEHATRGKYYLEIHPPKSYYKTFRATASFQDPDEGQRTLKGLNQRVIGDKLLNVKLSLSSSVRYAPAVYQVIEDAVKELKSELENKFGESVRITEKQDKWGNTIIQISSDDVQTFAVAKNVLNTVIQPDVTECRSQILRQFLLSHNCYRWLEEIQSSTSTYIYADRRTMTIKIYGTEANVTRAKIQLNETLCKLEGHESKCYELKAPGKPPGLMKYLIAQFGLELQVLTNQDGIETATLDPRKHVLTVFATKEAHTFICELIEAYDPQAIATINGEEAEFVCCVCFTPIDSPKDIFRLEYCGHNYCLDCIQLQIAPNAITFPLQCAECSHPFIWQDCEHLFQRTNFTCQQLAAASLKTYMAANTQTVRSCPTPDCEMVYVVSDDGKRFICSHCGVHLCTKCHNQYHDGLTCAMYQAGKHGEKEFEEWLSAKPGKRKRCPKCNAPIEKIDGCNNVHCEHCKTSICWVCLAHFDSDQKCYTHLRKSHGGFA